MRSLIAKYLRQFETLLNSQRRSIDRSYQRLGLESLEERRVLAATLLDEEWYEFGNSAEFAEILWGSEPYTIKGSIGSNDVDYFEVDLNAGSKVNLSVLKDALSAFLTTSISAYAGADAMRGVDVTDGPNATSASAHADEHYYYAGSPPNPNWPDNDNYSSVDSEGSINRSGLSGSISMRVEFEQEVLGRLGGATSGGSVTAEVVIDSNYSGRLSVGNSFGDTDISGFDQFGTDDIGSPIGIGWTYEQSGPTSGHHQNATLNFYLSGGTNYTGTNSAFKSGTANWTFTPDNFLPVVGIFDETGALLETTSGDLEFEASRSGRYYIVVSHNAAFDGDGGEDDGIVRPYTLEVDVQHRPRVVEVLTHGFLADPDPNFTALGEAIKALAAGDPNLRDRVATYTPQWDSNEYFGRNFARLFLGELMLTDEGNENDEAGELLRNLAADSADLSDGVLRVAAHRVVNHLKSEFLLPPVQSNESQVIELIGHSRGAGLNAVVARMLYNSGYRNIHFIALDGYDSDWTYGDSLGGALSKIDIDGFTATTVSGSKLNFQAGKGLAFEPAVRFLDFIGTLPNEAVELLQERNEFRAPNRSGFKDYVLDSSVHTSITEEFTENWLHLTYVGSQVEYEDFNRSPFSSSALDASRISSEENFPLTSGLNWSIGFSDGNIEKLGGYNSQIIALGPTGYDAADQIIASLSDEFEQVSLFWWASGDVGLARSAGNTSIELRAGSLSPASIGQTVVFPESATAIEFDLTTIEATPGDLLYVLFENHPIAEIALTASLDTIRQSVMLEAGDKHGEVAFVLVGIGANESRITLDNFSFATIANAAPELTELSVTLPTVTMSLENPGIAVAELVAGMTDDDEEALRGIAVTGVDTAAGKLQITFTNGGSWQDVGHISGARSLLLDANAGTRLRFVANGSVLGPLDDVLRFRAWDQTTGLAALSGEYADTTQNGGSSAFSSQEAVASITVLSGNRAPAVAASTFDLYAKAANGTVVGQIQATDADAGQTLSYSIVGGNNGAFAINSATGAVTVVNSKLLTGSTHALTVRVADNGSPSMFTDAVATVRLLTKNTPPTVAVVDAAGPVTIVGNKATAVIPEHTPTGTQLGILRAIDANEPGRQLSLVRTDKVAAIAFDPLTGRLSVANGALLDFEKTKSITLTFKVTDNGLTGLKGVATTTFSVVLNLADLNEAPTFPATAAAFRIKENNAARAAVGAVTATDPDKTAPNKTLTYSLVSQVDQSGNAVGVFAIADPRSGKITVPAAGALNFEAAQSYTLVVRATDGGGFFTDKIVTVTVIDVNEAPTVALLDAAQNPTTTLTITENAAAGSLVGYLRVTNPDVFRAETFKVALSDASGALAVGPYDAATGLIAITVSTDPKKAAKLDFEKFKLGRFTLAATVTDSGFVSNDGSKQGAKSSPKATFAVQLQDVVGA